MIILNADESMLLLITKYWKHKDYPVLRNFKGHFIPYSREAYIQACCNIRCFGVNREDLKADVFSIYMTLIEKVLSKRTILRAYENSMKSYIKDRTMFQELISELCLTKVQDEIELDYSLVETKGKEHLIYNACQCEAIKRFNAGERPMYSTDISDSLSCGYGVLDNYGFWEFPLPEKYWRKEK